MNMQLPLRPNLEQLRKQAKALLKDHQAADAEALGRIRESHTRWQSLADSEIAATRFALADAQHTIAKEYGFESWAKLKSHVAAQHPLRQAGQRAGLVDAELVEAIRKAAGQGDIERLKTLLDEHPELIDEPGGQGVRTALHQAVFGKSEAAVKLLLDRGANPNIRCEGDNAYPLHFAVEKHLFPIIRLLVEHGADTVGEGDYHELGVLGWATAWEYISADREMVNYLLAHGARHNIFSAVAMGEVDAIRELVAKTPSDLERRMNGTKMRRRPLHLAVIKKQMGSLLTVLDLGAKTESLDEAGLTALDQAALNGDREMARMLFERGARIRLPAAIGLHRERDVERLLARDPGTLKCGGRWANLIVRASECSSGEIVEELIAAGADVNIHDEPTTAIDSTSGFTPLHAAAWHGNMSAIEALMRHGADVTARETKWHGTPAGWADYAGHIEARNLILRGAVDIIEAIQYGLVERARAILEEDQAILEQDGAATDGKILDRRFHEYRLFPHDAEGWYTPLAYAVARSRTELVRLLVDHGADVTLCSPDGESLIEIAAKAGYAEIAALLHAAQTPEKP